MTTAKKQGPKRNISKARLLIAVEETATAYQLGGESFISELTNAIEQDIVKEAKAKA